MNLFSFSELSDDQLIGLVQAALQEAVRRNPIVRLLVSRALLGENSLSETEGKKLVRGERSLPIVSGTKIDEVFWSCCKMQVL